MVTVRYSSASAAVTPSEAGVINGADVALLHDGMGAVEGLPKVPARMVS